MDDKILRLISLYTKKPYNKIWEAFFEQYASYGRWVQNIFIVADDAKESAALHLFLGIIATPMVPFKVPYRLLEKRWRELYPSVPLLDFLAAYFDKPLESNKEKAVRGGETKREFFKLLIEGASTHGKQWLEAVTTQTAIFRREHKLYEQLGSTSDKSFKYVAEALDILPVKFMRLPVLAQKITGDPHYFDRGRVEGDIFLDALAYLASFSPNDEKSNPEWEAEVLLLYGLIRDDTTNNVMCSGLVGCNNEAKCNWMVAAVEAGSPQVYPLREILKWEGFRPIMGNDIFVVENPSVYSTLVDDCWERYGKLPPVICSSGQFKLAVWQILRRVVNENCRIHYSGDFDPEGILIAQRLSNRYPRNVHFWRLTVEDYLTAGPTEPVAITRLKQLDGVKSFVLQSLCDAIRKEKKAAYQEGIMKPLTADILSYNSWK